MTLATQAMEAFGISGQQGARHRGWHRAATPRQASMEKDSPLPWPSHYMEKLLLSRAKPRTTRHASQKERSQHAADQFHAAAVDGDVEDFELTVRSWAGPSSQCPPAALPLQHQKKRRQSRSTGGDTNPQQDAGALPSTTEQQTWLPQIKPACKPPPHSQPGTSYMRPSTALLRRN
jgi:hypothetical protein